MRFGRWLATCAFVTLASSPARADDAGLAEQLFRDGKRLVAEGKVAEACRAFEGSYRKQAAATTLLNLADCHEKDGRLASAWSEFSEAERTLRRDPAQAALKEVAQARAAALEPRLSRLRIDVPPASAVDGLEVLRGDTVLDHAEWGAAIALDGGQYNISARAPGRESWQTTVTVRAEGDRPVVEVPSLPTVTTPVAVRRGTAPKSRLGFYVIAGGGALAVGSLALGYLAKGKLDDAKALCGSDLRCASEADRVAGQALIDASRLRGNVATGLAVGGLVAVGAGVAILLLRKPARAEPSTATLHVTPVVSAEQVGVALGGSL